MWDCLCSGGACAYLSGSLFTHLHCARLRSRAIIDSETDELKKLDNNDAPYAPQLASDMRVAAGLLQTTRHYQNLQASLDSACSEITGARRTLFERSENRRQIPSRSAF
jgi:hypothetical protein